MLLMLMIIIGASLIRTTTVSWCNESQIDPSNFIIKLRDEITNLAALNNSKRHNTSEMEVSPECTELTPESKLNKNHLLS